LRSKVTEQRREIEILRETVAKEVWLFRALIGYEGVIFLLLCSALSARN
jgi:hypothetical protein